MNARANANIIDVPWRDGTVAIEYAWVGATDADAPVMVFLHEGLGSVSMWRDTPERIASAVGMRGLVYSRPGYGASTPRPRDERWPVDFMHAQAIALLPALLARFGIDPLRTPPWLFGHSDGGSIALLHASAYPDRVAGLVVLAPHIVVEDVSIASIANAKRAYETTDLRERLAKYHADVDSAFWGWNDVWLDPAFRDWRIVERLSAIRCPILAVQGRDDEYGTLAQIEGIRAAARNAELLVFDDCGHAPHRDHPEALTAAVQRFVERHSTRGDPR